MTSLYERMPDTLGQFVTIVKDYVYRDLGDPLSQNIGMLTKIAASKYKAAFCARLKAVREAAGFTQEEFAKQLGVSRDKYAKYESRSLLPHHLISRVCEITGHESWFILTGQASPTPKSHASRPTKKVG